MTLLDFIICDDVRQEVGNKHTFVGIYDTINFKGDKIEWPIRYRICFYIRFYYTKNEPKPDGFLIEFKKDRDLVHKYEDKFNIPKEEGLFNLVITDQAFPIGGPGVYNVNVIFKFICVHI